MSNLSLVPAPIVFNKLKHHLGYIQNFITDKLTCTSQELAYQLLSLGESQMDVYIGEMSPSEIAHEITRQLQEIGRYKKEAFIELLHKQHAGYATLQLSDGTIWVLRLGEVEDRYIHIHPGRYAAHTLRVKSGALKTAIAVSVWIKNNSFKEISLDVINLVRKEVLNASPIKSISASEGIGKLIWLIHSGN